MARKQVYNHGADALVGRHQKVAAEEVAPQQAAAGAGPQMKPAIVDVQHESAART